MRMLLVLAIYPFNMNMQYEYAHICNTLLLYSTLCTRLVSLSLSLSLSLSTALSLYHHHDDSHSHSAHLHLRTLTFGERSGHSGDPSKMSAISNVLNPSLYC